MKQFWSEFMLVERNMWGSHRPTVAKWMLVALAIVLTMNIFTDLYRSSGMMTAVGGGLFSLVCWFILLPVVIYSIDYPVNRNGR